MADTSDLNPDVERREGSSPSAPIGNYDWLEAVVDVLVPIADPFGLGLIVRGVEATGERSGSQPDVESSSLSNAIR